MMINTTAVVVNSTLSGRTSLLIPKKLNMAMTHEHRPATFPQTFLAVSRLKSSMLRYGSKSSAISSLIMSFGNCSRLLRKVLLPIICWPTQTNHTTFTTSCWFLLNCAVFWAATVSQTTPWISLLNLFVFQHIHLNPMHSSHTRHVLFCYAQRKCTITHQLIKTTTNSPSQTSSTAFTHSWKSHLFNQNRIIFKYCSIIWRQQCISGPSGVWLLNGSQKSAWSVKKICSNFPKVSWRDCWKFWPPLRQSGNTQAGIQTFSKRLYKVYDCV